MYTSYCTETPVRVHGTASIESVPVLTLIGLSPISQTSDDCDEDRNGDEATTFNAQAHLKFFSDILQFYGQDFKEWCVCLIAGNTNTNLRAAKLAGVPHVGCASHRLNLEVDAMVRRTRICIKPLIRCIRQCSRPKKKLKKTPLV